MNDEINKKKLFFDKLLSGQESTLHFQPKIEHGNWNYSDNMEQRDDNLNEISHHSLNCSF